MGFTTSISVADAAAHLDDADWFFVDCRFDLADPGAGWSAFLREHIPGAVYADLEADLSGEASPGRTGRHPLPAKSAFTARMRELGLTDAGQVVVYDEGSGAMAAARLWWLLRWAGHDAVAVLDGGLSAWREEGLATRSGEAETPARGDFTGRFRDELLVGVAELTGPGADGLLLVDSRAADRYRGENESIDPVAGHIPGAVSSPFPANLDAAGRLLPPERLREKFQETAKAAPEDVVFYCGSGVTAAHNVLAYASAYGALPRLYAGSWSEWITDPARPVAVGEGT